MAFNFFSSCIFKNIVLSYKFDLYSTPVMWHILGCYPALLKKTNKTRKGHLLAGICVEICTRTSPVRNRKEKRQCTCNVALRRVRPTIVIGEGQ